MAINEGKVKKPRAVSAKHSQQKPRPSSANRTSPKIEFIENVYTNLLTSKRQGRTVGRIGTNFGDQTQQKVSFSRGYKEIEVLKQQNNFLKKQINNLKEQLGKQKGKTEQFRRKNSEYTKKLNIQFEKEMYWSNNSNTNMVMGIKNQYQKIKQKYHQKCQQMEELIKQNASIREDKDFYQELLFQNSKLLKRVKEAQEEVRLLKHGTLTSIVQETLDAHKKSKFQLIQKIESLQRQLVVAKQKYQDLAQDMGLKDKKIQFLDKQLLVKGNDQHAARKSLKKLQKEIKRITDQYSGYREEKEEIINMLEAKVKRVKEVQQRKASMQSEIFKKQIEQKNKKIQKLEAQIAYLGTLMKYWKPLDEANEMAAAQIIENNNISTFDKEIILEYSMGSTMMKFNPSRNPPNREDDQAKSITRSINQSKKGQIDVNKYYFQPKNINEAMAKSIDLTKNLGQQKKRVQITADKRQTQEGVKTRKVVLEQVLDIFQTLKYRFIGMNTLIQQVRRLFDYKLEENNNMLDDWEEQSWKKQYISMREAKEILLKNPVFGLNQNEAELLSRYLIEDSPTDYVYCDPNNENMRTIVKSIIKKEVGEYDLHSNSIKLKEEAEELIKKYETNLQSALRTTAPKGIISKKKLLQLFKGLGIQLKPQVESYILGKLVTRSENLSTLKYNLLFER